MPTTHLPPDDAISPHARRAQRKKCLPSGPPLCHFMTLFYYSAKKAAREKWNFWHLAFIQQGLAEIMIRLRTGVI